MQVNADQKNDRDAVKVGCWAKESRNGETGTGTGTGKMGQSMMSGGDASKG